MSFEPWVGRDPFKPRHCFAEAAYFFFAGLMWQADKWAVRFHRIPGAQTLLNFCGWYLDDLRMFFSGHCWKEAPYRGHS